MPPTNITTQNSEQTGTSTSTQTFTQEQVQTTSVAVSVIPQKSRPIDFFIFLAIFSLKITLVTSALTAIDRLIRKFFPVKAVASGDIYSSFISSSYFSGFPTFAVSSLITSIVGFVVFFIVLRNKENKLPGYNQIFVSTLEKSAVAYLCLSGLFSVIIKAIYDQIESNSTTQSITMAVVSSVILLSVSIYHFFWITREREKANLLSKIVFPVTVVFVVILIIICFVNFDRPVSLAKQAEDTKISAEMNRLQSGLTVFTNDKGTLPASLEELKLSASYYRTLGNGDNTPPITYKIIDQLVEDTSAPSYGSGYVMMKGKIELCSDFNADTTLAKQSSYNGYGTDTEYTDYTKHAKGHVCFTPTIKANTRKVTNVINVQNYYGTSTDSFR